MKLRHSLKTSMSPLFVFLCLLVLVLMGGGYGCSQCRFDTDCQGSELCTEGVCKVTDPKKEPPPQTECLPTEQRSCYSGTPETAGVGVCQRGQQICDASGKWGPCQGEVLPGDKEECDSIDNNCNGQVDEGCECKDGDTQKCYTASPPTRDKGICEEGQQLCINGIWGTCIGQKLPQAEICDNIDNNCNGLIDDDLSEVCQTPCGIGKRVCIGGKFSACDSGLPVPEICGDGKDNDCDGSMDEGCECTPNETRPCYTGPAATKGVGPCKGGTQTCSASGKWLECEGQITPNAEDCNNKDDDCDGRVEGPIRRACKKGCNSGDEECLGGQWSTSTL